MALRIYVHGIVQGVGFRPFVYRLATRLGLRGYVRNISGSAVEIFVEGDRAGEFVSALMREKPRPAVIEKVEVEEVEPRGFSEFVILKSDISSYGESMIPPDLSICEECLKEIEDVNDRRYKYAFNSCAYCGPRYSMMYRIPYDRENTAMKHFPLCEECEREFKSPENERRFHAQGISCPRCGPKLWLEDSKGRKVDVPDPVNEVAKLILEGKFVAIKGIGGFHIAADAYDDDVVGELRRRKRRPQRPFAVMAYDIKVVEEFAEVVEPELLLSPERPIVLLEEKKGVLSKLVAPGLKHVGVFLPYTALHYMIMKVVRAAIMTSGNPHGRPMVTRNDEARRELSGIVDYFLMHNRRIVNRVDDSVIRPSEEGPLFLRRGRGYAPMWITLSRKLERDVVAFGAELQNAGAIGFGDKVVLTQYIGDVDEAANLGELDRYLKFLMKNYKMKPEECVLVADLHPTYSSGKLAELWANKYGAELVKVQHHWAHLLSALAEAGEEGGIGIAVDGLGYGTDGMLWGGEVMEFDLQGFRRIGHLEPIPMPSGDRDTIYPLRLAYSLSYLALGDEGFNKMRKLGFGPERFEYPEELSLLELQLKRGAQLKSTSLGRALDALSALLGVCSYRSYDGEPAMKLEAVAKDTGLRFDVKVEGDMVKTSHLFGQAIEALERGVDRRGIAYAYIYALGYGLGMLANGEKEIYLSGGAAVNEILRAGIRAATGVTKLRVPLRSPPGDGGIAVGQVLAAGFGAQ